MLNHLLKISLILLVFVNSANSSPMLMSDYTANTQYLSFSMAPTTQSSTVSSSSESLDEDIDANIFSVDYSRSLNPTGDFTPIYGFSINRIMFKGEEDNSFDASGSVKSREAITSQKYTVGGVLKMEGDLQAVLLAEIIKQGSSLEPLVYNYSAFIPYKFNNYDQLTIEAEFKASRIERLITARGGHSYTLGTNVKYKFDKWTNLVVTGLYSLYDDTQYIDGVKKVTDPGFSIGAQIYAHPIPEFGLFAAINYDIRKNELTDTSLNTVELEESATTTSIGLAFAFD